MTVIRGYMWDQLDHYSVVLTALKEQVQIVFGDINARFGDLTIRLETLGLRANMNQGRREARVEDDACGQSVIELVHANPYGQYNYEYSSNKKDLF
jgi:hypothetical protein